MQHKINARTLLLPDKTSTARDMHGVSSAGVRKELAVRACVPKGSGMHQLCQH